MMDACKRRAFTLIELLVVIALTTVLIALLLPALIRSKEIGNRAICLRNLRSIVQSVNMYAMEAEDRILHSN